MSVQADSIKPDVPTKSDRWKQVRKNRWAYTFISPFYILWMIFGLGPFLFSLYLIFVKWDGLGPLEFIGLKNFIFLFKPGGGEVFWKSIGNGVILFFMYVPIMTFLAIVLAVILNSQRVRGFRFFRTLIFAPYVTSMIAAGFTFRLILEYDGGLFNILLNVFGMSSVPWLEDAWWARISLCLLVIWGWLGYNMVLMLAGLQTIPRELTEAAQIDGATPVQAFFHITIPLLRPVIIFSLILSTMGTFALFNEVYALTFTPGGPMRANLTPFLHIYNVAFQDFRFGRASAMSYMYAILILAVSWLQLRYFGREDN
ncbi:MAG: sugar ABC transporter permease [Anaerolineales bacterium]|nr:MAG: sugar ABC transporter permease [Anaerolineales bacterium]